MNLYTVTTKIRIGHPNSTHYDITPTFHVSATAVDVAARLGEAKARRWSEKKYEWFLGDTSKSPIHIAIIGVTLLDEDWQ